MINKNMSQVKALNSLEIGLQDLEFHIKGLVEEGRTKLRREVLGTLYPFFHLHRPLYDGMLQPLRL